MKTAYIYLFLLVSLRSYADLPDWEWKNPMPQGNRLNQVFAFNSNTMIAAGECGVILKTTNAGNNWTTTHYNDTTEFNSIFFINSQTGWIAGGIYAVPLSVNTIIKTTNAGANWIKLVTGFNNNNLTSVFFIDANTGFAGGGTFNEGKIIKTTNGGSAWTTLPASFTFQVECLYFLNQNTGWAGSNGFISKTTNGGINWIDSPAPGLIFDIEFNDSANGFATRTSGNYYKTTNGGLNWISGNTNGGSISFVTSETGWLSGPSNPSRVFKTTNSGLNWATYNFQSLEQIISLDFLDIQTGWGVGLYGAIQRSTNGGANWVSRLYGVQSESLTDACFVNMNTGFTCGGYGYTGEIMKTTDGGENWQQIYSLPLLARSIDFVDLNTGWVCGSGYTSNITGRIWKTTDGGTNWEQQFSILIEDYTDVEFFNANTGFVFGYNVFGGGGDIKKTTNGGLNWTAAYLGGASAIKQSCFIDANTGWVCCSAGKVYRTTNAGVNWDLIQTAAGNELYSIHFINYNTGWVGTINGELYGTTNAGISWQLQNDNPYSVTDIHFINNSIGWASHSNGTLLYTTNSGINWNNYPRFTYNGITTISFLSSDIGFVFGYKGMILKTTNGSLAGFEHHNQVTPDVFSLSQNYPNPFNPVTNIKFDLPKPGFVNMTIYDLLGHEITTLINQQMQGGSYSADWDASAYPSGVYFYKIEAGDYIETKKMVLVK